MNPIISSYCSHGGCAAVKFDGDVVLVWSTKFPTEGTWFDREEWSAFIAGVKDGEFDLPD